MRIVTVLGARPQFIKASVVSAHIAKDTGIHEVVVHTGQHFDDNMSQVFFSELGMRDPQYHFGIHGGAHGEMTGRMLLEIERVLVREKPSAVLVYGDTNSTLAGALAAAKLQIPVAHVEAGVRSFNMRMPEEINRILTDRISTWLFSPTNDAIAHLRREGIDKEKIHQVGDVMYDVAIYHGQRAAQMNGDIVSRVGLAPKGYVLATVHRAENTDDPERLRIIVESLIEVARQIPVLWPLHPRTRGALTHAGLLNRLAESTKLVEPLGYLDMVSAERHAAVIATDSGGVQKEAFFHGVPCVTLRDETEWVELVAAGWNRLAPPRDVAGIVAAVVAARGSHGEAVRPYGDGRAAALIVSKLIDTL